MLLFLFFFFQAEDGIRDGHVTGVQTCALPIFARPASRSTARSSPTSPSAIPSRLSSSRRSPSRRSDHARPPGSPLRAAGASEGNSAGGRAPAFGSQDRDAGT